MRIFFSRCVLLWAALAAQALAQGEEFRGLWADAFHAGLRNASEVSAYVNAARTGNMNALFPQVRKRGDAYYRGGLEPVATGVAAGFDPLADMVAKAHDTSGGKQRLEVHAWLVTYNIWNNQNSPPSQPTHPYNLHPEWLTQKYRSNPATQPLTQWDGGNYQLDQGHPAVQQHTFDVAMDILRRYDIDGLHFDYIRYSDGDSSGNNQPWGYHPVSVERFKKLKKRTTTPAPGDAVWLQWRRDQVTALLRKIYLHALAEKPHARISAALITYGGAPSLSASSWLSSAAYSRVLQDWRAWLEEGILDLGCPMAYKTSNTDFTNWTAFVRERQYNRASAMGMGWYLNPVSRTLEQIGIARGAGSSGKKAAGVMGYSYAVSNNNTAPTVPLSEFLAALTTPATAQAHGHTGTPVFQQRAALPPMPWKNDASKGHLMGFVRDAAADAMLDGAALTLAGPVSRTLVTDGTGFYGTVDLPAGAYTLTVDMPGYAAVSRSLTIDGRHVSQATIVLEPPPLELLSHQWDPGTGQITLVWSSQANATYRVEYAENLQDWEPLATGIAAAGSTTTFQSPPAPGSETRRFWRVVRETDD